jgi:type I restriction enzyme S subunit
VSKEEKDLPETLPRWDIPASWRWVSVSAVGKVITGNTPPTKEIANYGNYMPFVKPPELRDRGVWTATDGLSEKGVKFSRTLPAGAVLVSCIGGLGKTGLAKIPVAFNQQINAIVFDGRVLPEFGFYYMQTLKPWLYEVSSATTLPIVNKGKFLRAPFPLAPIKDQKRIVSEIEKQFSRLDEAVASLKRIQANLKRYKTAVLKAAVEGKLTEQWRKDHPDVEPADQLLKRILAERRAKWEESIEAKVGAKQGVSASPGFGDVGNNVGNCILGEAGESFASPLPNMKAKGIKPKDDSWKKKYKEPDGPDTTDLPELPEGWVWASLESISEVIDPNPSHRMPKYVAKGIPLISSENFVAPMGIDFTRGKQVTDETFQDQKRRYKIEIGDFAFSRIGTIGKTRFLPTDRDYCLSHALVVIKAIGTELNRKYLNYAVSSDAILQQAREGVQSVGVPDLGMAKMRSFQIPLPPSAEQGVVAAEIDSHLSVIEELETTIKTNLKRAERLRQTILQQAFSDGLILN